jgi:hypothetical protein
MRLRVAPISRFLNRVRKFDSCRGHSRLSCIKLLGPLAIDGLPRKDRGLRTDCRLFLVSIQAMGSSSGLTE